MSAGSSDRIDALPVGTRLQGYVVEGVLGHGGFGIVYRARHAELRTVAAIKEYMPVELSVRRDHSVAPRSSACRDPYHGGLRRFLDEARQLVRFQSYPCVVSCQDFFRANGTAYLVMEYVEGLSLAELLRRREERGQPFAEEELLEVMVPLLGELAAVHGEGVLHRDIKPANILIRRSDARPVLIDFGAAKQAVAEQSRSMAPYTEGYAAIEQGGGGRARTVDGPVRAGRGYVAHGGGWRAAVAAAEPAEGGETAAGQGIREAGPATVGQRAGSGAVFAGDFGSHRPVHAGAGEGADREL